MEKLIESSCVACRADSPLATDDEILLLKVQVPDWTIIDKDGIGKLERVFHFDNFLSLIHI